jgi:hypothetical protein
MNARTIPALALSAFLMLSAGCGRRDADTGASVAKEPTSALSVKDIDLGSSVNADKTVANHTGDFKPSETIYASVETTGSGKGTLKARWTYQEGQVVDETSQDVTTSGPANTEFPYSNPSGMPIRNYRVVISLNRDDGGTNEFEVKR